jgi:hypothetical protein
MPPRINQIRQPIAYRLNHFTAKYLPDMGISDHGIEDGSSAGPGLLIDEKR